LLEENGKQNQNQLSDRIWMALAIADNRRRDWNGLGAAVVNRETMKCAIYV
jgi:hypothetical protein